MKRMTSHLSLCVIGFAINGCAVQSGSIKPTTALSASAPNPLPTLSVPDPEPPRVVAQSKYFTINGSESVPGTPLTVLAGPSTVTFSGPVLRPFSVPHELSGYETAKFLGCLALLPICALTGNQIFPKTEHTEQIKYEEFQCTGSITFHTNNDHEYTVEIVNAMDSLPILRVSDVSRYPAFQTEGFINCEPADSSLTRVKDPSISGQRNWQPVN